MPEEGEEEDDDCDDFETASVMPSPVLPLGVVPSSSSSSSRLAGDVGGLSTGGSGTGTGASAEGGGSIPPPPPAAVASTGVVSTEEGPYVYEAHQTSPHGLTDGRKGCRMC